MDGEGEVVEAHGGFGGYWVTGGILFADDGGVEEGAGVDCIADEAEDVGRRKSDGCSSCRAPAPV